MINLINKTWSYLVFCTKDLLSSLVYFGLYLFFEFTLILSFFSCFISWFPQTWNNIFIEGLIRFSLITVGILESYISFIYIKNFWKKLTKEDFNKEDINYDTDTE